MLSDFPARQLMTLLMANYALLNIILLTIIFTASNIPTLQADPQPVRRTHKLFFYSALIAQMFVYALLTTAVNLVIIYSLGHGLLSLVVNALIVLLMWFLILGNSKVYARYRFNINRSILKLSFGKGAREVVQPTQSEVLVIVLSLVVIFAVSITCQLAEAHPLPGSWYHRALQGILFVIAITYLANQIFYLFVAQDPKQRYRQYTCKLFGYHAFSWVNMAQKVRHSLITKQASTGSTPNWKACEKPSPITYPATMLEKQTPESANNILVIAIEACRYDMIQKHVMPFVHGFAQNACQFDNHWSHGNTTQAGIFSLFYGLTPNYWSSMIKHSTPPILMQRLRELNYTPAIYSSATLQNPAFDRNVFLNSAGLRISTPGQDPLIRDKQITDDFCRFIKEDRTEDPFFGFLFYDAAHGYYALDDLPKQFSPVGKMNHITLKSGTAAEPIFNQYKNALHCIDQLIAQVIETLDDHSLLEHTIIAITADHGQEFNDFNKNYWEHPSNFGKYQLKVPMILHWPGKKTVVHTHKTLHSDIAPTLLRGALGVSSNPADYCHGQDLFDSTHRPYHIAANYCHYALVEDDYIYNLPMDGSIQTYDKNLNHLADKQPSAALLRDAAERMKKFHTK